MSNSEYLETRYSVSLQTQDLAVLHALRALSQHCYGGAYKQIAWGGTGERQWRANDDVVTFRFKSDRERATFLSECRRVLVGGLWSVVATSDNDPAEKQRP